MESTEYLTRVYLNKLNHLQNALARHIQQIELEGFVRSVTVTDLPIAHAELQELLTLSAVQFASERARLQK